MYRTNLATGNDQGSASITPAIPLWSRFAAILNAALFLGCNRCVVAVTALLGADSMSDSGDFPRESQMNKCIAFCVAQ